LKISIITVCFNSALTIADTVASVSRQSYENIEHIFVDGASSDETLSVIRSSALRQGSILSESDQGIYDAMNKGLRLATGDIIGFLNADDFYPTPDVLKTVAHTMAANGVDCCYGDLCYVQQVNLSSVVRYWHSSPFVSGMFARAWAPPHPTFFVRRETYERLGGFNLSYKIAADAELMARFLEVGKISSCYIPAVLVHMRLGGTTNRSLRNVIKQNLEIRRAYLALGLSFSWVRFLAHKVYSRAQQFFRRPV
jgi:glycosyltransferase involved in cell wall biosynthesis